MAWTDNLVSVWSQDDAAGANGTDSFGSNHLTVGDKPGSAAGKLVTARDYERGSFHSLQIASNSSLLIGNTSCFFSTWVQLESKPAGNMVVVAKTTGASGEFFLLWQQSSDRFAWQMFSSGSFGGGHTLVANTLGAPSLATWYHLLAEYDAAADELRLWINGVAETPVSHAGGAFGTTGNLELGGNAFSAFWDGLIDETVFWKGRTSTSDERTALYNGGAGFAYPYVSSPNIPAIASYYHGRRRAG